MGAIHFSLRKYLRFGLVTITTVVGCGNPLNLAQEEGQDDENTDKNSGQDPGPL